MSRITVLRHAAASATTQAIIDRFQRLARSNDHRVAVIDGGRAVTFGQLWQLAYQYIGYRPPTRAIVPIVAQPTADTIAEALAVWLCGAIPLPIPLDVQAKSLDTLIDQAARTAHWCQPWRAHLHTAAGGRHLWVAGGEPPTNPRLGDAIGLTPGGTALITAPLHAAAIFETVIRQLLTAGTVVLQPDFTTAGWLHTATQTHADWAVLAPGQIKALLRTREQRPGRLGTATQALRRVVVPATVPLPGAGNHLADFATAADVTVTTWYHAPAYDGATTTPTDTTLTPLPGLRLRTIDPAGQPTPPGVPGLIEAASTDCTAVAHRADQPCPPASAWRSSGDIGTLTASGRLTLHRLEPAERYLSPTGQRRCAALRRTVTAHPDVVAATVHIVPDEHNRPRAQLRIWPRPGLTTPLTAATIAAHCTAHDTPVFAHHILVTATRTRDTRAGA
ncbi:hypothetical protein ABT297_24895 [Dactylosporangium sp. NPDC000555]|uniref:hypothetical protein n=1 Tax=Dactylosporangium sp. NPDC000555 TaxID=3154260 RepID=UPI003321973F